MASREVLGRAADELGAGADQPKRRGHARSRRRFAWWLLALVVLGTAAATLAPHVFGRRVNVVQPERSPLVQTVVTSGRVLPPAEITLSALVPGSIQRIAVKEGDHVKKGQLLVQIDPTEAQAAVAQARAALSRAHAQRQRIHRLAVAPDGSPLLPVALTATLLARSALIATLTGIVAAVLPARRAARLDPAVAIRYE